MSSCPEYEHFAEFYDHVDLYRHRPDLAFYLDLAREAAGRVLEAGCGTGRLLLPIARAGLAIDGLDSAPAMIDICRASLAREPADVQARVRLYLGDMCDPPIDEQYALVTIPFRAFLHLLTVDDQLRALTALRERLQPGGRLVLDVFNPSLPMLTDQRITIDPVVEPAFTMPDGRRVVRSWRIVSRDYFAQTQLIDFTFEATDREGRVTVQREQFTLRFMFRYEAEHLLERCGFRVDAVYADYDRRPVGTIYPGDLVFVATRR
jgi:SAM-dependent methyltransferase